MSDKKKTNLPTSRTLKNRLSTVSAATSPRPKINKAKNNPASKIKATVVNRDAVLKHNILPDFDAENRQVAYGKFLRNMLDECITDEKMEREETYIDMQMAQLADRFGQTMDLLSKTSARLKDISFVAEQKRLIDLKSNDCNQFYEVTDSTNSQKLLEDLSAAERSHLDRIELKNIDFGYDKPTGHEQLLDAVNETIEGLEQIKQNSKLDLPKFKEYQKSQTSVTDVEDIMSDLQNLKMDFDSKFPKLNEKLLNEASEKIAKKAKTYNNKALYSCKPKDLLFS